MAKAPIIFALAGELEDATRLHLQFLIRYALGNVEEAAALAEVPPDKFRALLARHRIEVKTGNVVAVAKNKVEKVLEAVRLSPLHASEIHARIGGSYGALGVVLSQMKARGEIVAQGQQGKYRYALP